MNTLHYANRSIRPRVLFVSGRETSYVRNTMIVRTLQRRCDTTVVSGRAGASLSANLARLVPPLLAALRRAPDLVVLGFYSHPLAPLVRRLTRKPILFDPFVSTFDTLVLDREAIAPHSPAASAILAFDQAACRSADHLLADTRTHASFYQATLALRRDSISTLYLGADETVFYPLPRLAPASEFVVFTYATFLPIHGLPIVIRAAKYCEDFPIRFKIIGDGPVQHSVRTLIHQLDVRNVDLMAPVPYSELPRHIADAAVCLGGHFGASRKADLVIAGKTYQFVAMRKPVIVGDTEANREIFRHLHDVVMCPRQDAHALADAIITLYQQPDLADYLAENAFRTFSHSLTWSVLGRTLDDAVVQLL